MPPDLDAASIALTGDGGLRVEWRPDGHVSVYDPRWLRAHRDAGTDDDPRRRPAPVTWDAALSGALPAMDHDTVAGSDRDLLDWLRLLRDSGVAIATRAVERALARAPHRPRARDQIRRALQ